MSIIGAEQDHNESILSRFEALTSVSGTGLPLLENSSIAQQISDHEPARRAHCGPIERGSAQKNRAFGRLDGDFIGQIEGGNAGWMSPGLPPSLARTLLHRV
jgi:hypothetical protein